MICRCLHHRHRLESRLRSRATPLGTRLHGRHCLEHLSRRAFAARRHRRLITLYPIQATQDHCHLHRHESAVEMVMCRLWHLLGKRWRVRAAHVSLKRRDRSHRRVVLLRRRRLCGSHPTLLRCLHVAEDFRESFLRAIDSVAGAPLGAGRVVFGGKLHRLNRRRKFLHRSLLLRQRVAVDGSLHHLHVSEGVGERLGRTGANRRRSIRGGLHRRLHGRDGLKKVCGTGTRRLRGCLSHLLVGVGAMEALGLHLFNRLEDRRRDACITGRRRFCLRRRPLLRHIIQDHR